LDIISHLAVFTNNPPHCTDAIDYYSTCEVVKHIYIIWSEAVPPPGRISAKYEKSRNPSVSW